MLRVSPVPRASASEDAKHRLERPFDEEPTVLGERKEDNAFVARVLDPPDQLLPLEDCDPAHRSALRNARSIADARYRKFRRLLGVEGEEHVPGGLSYEPFGHHMIARPAHSEYFGRGGREQLRAVEVALF